MEATIEEAISKAFEIDGDEVNRNVQFMRLSYHPKLAVIIPLQTELDEHLRKEPNTPSQTSLKKSVSSVVGLTALLPLVQLPIDGHLDVKNIVATSIFGISSVATWHSAIKQSLDRYVRKLNILRNNYEILDAEFDKFTENTGFFELNKTATIANVYELYESLLTADSYETMYEQSAMYLEGTKETLETFQDQFIELLHEDQKLGLNGAGIEQRKSERRELMLPIEQLATFFVNVRNENIKTLAFQDSDAATQFKNRYNQILGQLKDISSDLVPALNATINYCSNLNNGIVSLPSLTYNTSVSYGML